jgi:hypothetical protein
MPFMFEQLEAYQKAVDFADEVASLTVGFQGDLHAVPSLAVAHR